MKRERLPLRGNLQGSRGSLTGFQILADARFLPPTGFGLWCIAGVGRGESGIVWSSLQFKLRQKTCLSHFICKRWRPSELTCAGCQSRTKLSESAFVLENRASRNGSPGDILPVRVTPSSINGRTSSCLDGGKKS